MTSTKLKKKKVTFTKQEIIEALLTEPNLRAGNWATPNYSDTCQVCAIGALMRKKLSLRSSSRITDACMEIITKGGIGDYARALREGRFFDALSCYFEQAVGSGYDATYSQRGEVADFVNKHFPSKISGTVSL